MTRLTRDLPFDGRESPILPVTLVERDDEYVLSRNPDGDVQVRGPDLHWRAAAMEKGASPDTLRQAPVVDRPLVQVTGSHHYLAFWVSGGTHRELRQLPFVYLLAEGRWAPLREVFLAPDQPVAAISNWNANCIQCHAVAGEPRQSEGRGPHLWTHYATTVAELGVACESCHGPGKAHTDRMRSPWARRAAAERLPVEQDDPKHPALGILSPQRLTNAESSALCGQCHAYFLPTDPGQWWDTGYAQKASPAVDYADSRILLSWRKPELAHAAHLSHELASIFWADGTIRVGGREYNGLVESPCFQGEGNRQLGCSTCHSMHGEKPDDQLRQDVTTDAVCTQCHEQLQDPQRALTHGGHVAGSPGSSCVNCHMPKTTYALLRGIRSHRISSPRRELSEPPSACGLCHVDKSAGWLDQELLRLFPNRAQLAAPAASVEIGAPNDVPHAVSRLLAGNAAERALFASALSDPGARLLVRADWSMLLLDRLREDPYAAVRRIAARVRSDLASPYQLEGALPATSAESPAAPHLDPHLLDILASERDDTPIIISE